MITRFRLLSAPALRFMFSKPVFFTAVFFYFISLSAVAETGVQEPPETAAEQAVPRKRGSFFPGIYFKETLEAGRKAEDAAPFWVRTPAEQEAYNRSVTDYASLLLNNDILIYYGHPLSRSMGILGRYSMEELNTRLTRLAEEYKKAGGRNIIKAFYIIYGTAHPRGEIGIINQDLLKRWVDFALENDMLVFIDHQIGRFDPVDSLREMFHWLHYPNVHLAFDPEWRTPRPNFEFGHLYAHEINRMQQVMEDYLYENDLPGERMLMFHQFHWQMVRERDKVEAVTPRVRLVHCISGIGSPGAKQATYYRHGTLAPNMPVKGFKLWYNFNLPGNHHDTPLMTPAQVYSLRPRPYIIMYQ